MSQWFSLTGLSASLGAVVPFRGPSLARPALVPGASHSTTAPKLSVSGNNHAI